MLFDHSERTKRLAGFLDSQTTRETTDLEGLGPDLGGRPTGEDLSRPKTKVDKEGLRKARLELLAATLWAKLGDSQARVKETDPNQLTIEVGDLSWVITVNDAGKIAISGFDSGVEQYIGKMPEQNSELALIDIADNAIKLINEDIEENSEPPAPPIHFGPEEEEDVPDGEGEMPAEEDAPPPAETAQGDGMGMEEMGGMPPDMGGPPMDPSMGMGSAPMPPSPGPPGMPMPGMGGPPAGMPGMVPPPSPMFPGGQMGAPPPMPGMPMASKRGIKSEQVHNKSRTATKRMAVAALDTTAEELQRISQSLEEGENGPFISLARRIDRVINTLEQTDI